MAFEGTTGLKTKGKAVIVGASSGIGEALARLLSDEGYKVGLCARRAELLAALQADLPDSVIREMDVSRPDQAIELFQELLKEMGDVDLVVITAGTGFINPRLKWDLEKNTIDVNVTGFCAMANAAVMHFVGIGKGHLVAISSIAALIGSHQAPAYNASKAFVLNYLEGLRGNMRSRRLPITVTDIRAGFVDTAMAQGPGIFWMASPEEAARQIYATISKKKAYAYVTRRWRLISWLFRIVPHSMMMR
jgi:short-subunit dehydrogenase